MKYLILWIFLPSLAWAELAQHCTTSIVHQVERPLASGKTFIYRFSVSPGPQATDESPLVIYLPGGPGQISMNMGLSYPDDFTVARTDPRGVGCNSSPDLQDEDLSSKQIARDVLEILRKLRPKKYLLHGTSYGTIVATMVASMAEEEGLPPPTAVVLEGTIGRAFHPDEYIQGFLQQWKWWKEETDAEVLSALEKPELFGIERKRWMAWLSAMMTYGKFPDGSSLLANDLQLLKESADNNRRQGLLRRVAKMSEPSSTEKSRLYRQITCREFVPDIRDIKYDFDFAGGDLTAIEQNWCGEVKMDRPFDSTAFQTNAAIYYFTGKWDPATPSWQSEYHFAHQKGSRVLVHVENAGHYALSGSLMSCSKELWRGIVQNEDLSNRLESCTPQVQIVKP